jgi:hypothetical protein
VSPAEQRELEAVVRLLQQLPDPEPPEGLGDRIVAAVAEQEAQGGFRRVAPWAGTALAAGLATLAVFTTAPNLSSPSLTSDGQALRPSVARPVASATTTGAREGVLRRPTLPTVAPVVVAARRRPSFFGPGASAALPSFDGRPMTLDTARILERRLDHAINHLLLDPAGFFEKLGGRLDGDRLVMQMAERAAQRGDAVEVALQLRQRAPGHPGGARMTEALLGSVLIQQSSRR